MTSIQVVLFWTFIICKHNKLTKSKQMTYRWYQMQWEQDPKRIKSIQAKTKPHRIFVTFFLSKMFIKVPKPTKFIKDSKKNHNLLTTIPSHGSIKDETISSHPSFLPMFHLPSHQCSIHKHKHHNLFVLLDLSMQNLRRIPHATPELCRHRRDIRPLRS